MKTIVNVVQNLLKPYVDNKDTAAKQAVESNIAPVEADATSASRSYSDGEQLVLNDILYDVIASITAEDPLTVGVNIAAAPKLSTAVRGKQEQIEVSSMPTASAAYVGKVLIYIGATGTYTSGQSYQCIYESESYSWQPVGGGITTASNVIYDNTQSGMTANDVQEAVDELNQALTNINTPLTATLAQGATSVTISNARITTSSNVFPVTHEFGFVPTDVQVTTGQIVMTFDAQDSAKEVGVLVF